MTINVYHHFPNNRNDEFEKRVLETLHYLKSKSQIMSDQLDKLTADVANMKTVEQSAVTLLQGLKAKLDAAGTDPVKLAALSADLESSTNDLAAAVTANTPTDNGGTPPTA